MAVFSQSASSVPPTEGCALPQPNIVCWFVCSSMWHPRTLSAVMLLAKEVAGEQNEILGRTMGSLHNEQKSLTKV